MVDDKGEITIFVNSRERTVSPKSLSPDGEISFTQVVNLAFDPPPSGPNILFTVSYRNGAGRPPAGELFAGEGVKIRKGTAFSVSFTDKS